MLSLFKLVLAKSDVNVKHSSKWLGWVSILLATVALLQQSSYATNNVVLSSGKDEQISTLVDKNITTTGIEHQSPLRKDLVFVDDLPELDVLLKAISPNAEVVILDPRRDGLAQITEVLRGRQSVDGIHILSHGNSGALRLGNRTLDQSSLETEAGELQFWATALAPEADIFLYGCNIAAGEDGKAFIQQLAHLTEADVAASDDLTGNAVLGGDWILEYHTGEIETKTTPDREILNTWNYSLQAQFDNAFNVFDLDNPTDLGGGVFIYEDAITIGIDTVDVRVTPTIDPGVSINQRDQDTNPGRFEPQHNNGGGNGVSYLFEFFAANTTNPVAIQNFAVSGIDIDSSGNGNTTEFHEIGGFDFYEVDITTLLTDSDAGGAIRFLGLPFDLPGIQLDPRSQYIATYNSPGITGFTLRLGAVGSNGLRLYSVAIGAPESAIVTPIQLTEPSDPPIAVDDVAITPQNIPITFSISNNDTPVDGALRPDLIDLDTTPNINPDAKTITVPGQGTFSVDNNGLVTFTPVPSFLGISSITYTIRDEQGDISNIATISVNVIAGNSPVAVDDVATTSADTNVTFSATDNDSDPDNNLDVASVDLDPSTPGIQNTFTIAGEGVFTVDDSGNVTFDPDPTFTGTATIPYTVSDDTGLVSNQANISVTIGNNPVAVDDVATTAAD
ncbi:MAG: DUF4347 domain-containing protein, partial [Synechococcaceae cyanobacterium SM2_3_1]|nr:DUF4347 domain-containing protein [Synechococcaceae cyanobacterium SM2_3_1]